MNSLGDLMYSNVNEAYHHVFIMSEKELTMLL